MEQEKDALYVVKKGDVIGIYRSLRDLWAEPGTSNASLIVYKGYGLSKHAEEYLGSHGLKNAAYSISALDVNDKTFSKLVSCPPQQPTSSREETSNKDPSPNRVLESLGKKLCIHEFDDASQVVHGPVGAGAAYHPADGGAACILEFDGASKGNPGPAGAGAVLLDVDGKVICRLREGVGIATNNVAEYRAVILGMKAALRKGFTHIRIRGDSNLVCMQVQGLWTIKSQNLIELNKMAKELKDMFTSFQIKHFDRKFNSQADALANQAVNLQDGQVEED